MFIIRIHSAVKNCNILISRLNFTSSIFWLVVVNHYTTQNSFFYLKFNVDFISVKIETLFCRLGKVNNEKLAKNGTYFVLQQK